MKRLLSVLTVFLPLLAVAQFAPSVGQLGTTAIHADSSIFTNWANGCIISRGPQNISAPAIGVTTVGDSLSAIGKAGENGVVSLGDGGFAILTFSRSITNGEGWDFAIFENSFSDDFLELAFVEVSSDGINYVRFPATSNTQDTLQVDGFGVVDATKMNNLAGKYRATYGTPFDLEELISSPLLDINAITHIKIIDVIGCINPVYATLDHFGNIINEPWPTQFPSGGFDLDAVGVIHQAPLSVSETQITNHVEIYPNPAKNYIQIKCNNQRISRVKIVSTAGLTLWDEQNQENFKKIDVSQFEKGVYIVSVEINGIFVNRKMIIAY